MRLFRRAPIPAELELHANALTAEWLRRIEASGPGNPPTWTWGPMRGGRTVRDHILPVLKRQTDSHCSYCDLYPVAPSSPETVDHFRPKGRRRWPELAYDWGNLFFACAACQSEKRERFDEHALKPDAPDYRWQDFFRFNTITGEIVPRPGIDEHARARAEATIELFGLNRRGRPRARRNAYHAWVREDKPPTRWRNYRFCLVPDRHRTV